MSETRIHVPCVNLDPGSWQFTRLLAAFSHWWESPGSVVLDFSRCTFLSAEGAAIVACFILRRAAGGADTQIDWQTVPSKVGKQLGRWGLTQLVGYTIQSWASTAIPILHQPRLDAKALLVYICAYIQQGQNAPNMNTALEKEVQRSLCELFTNTFFHAESPCGAIAIGQLYPNAKQVQICICDAGVGLVRKVQGSGFGTDSPGHAISWALQAGTTTRQDLNGPPGGLGLFLLREFVKINGGNLRIVANNGYFHENTSQTIMEELGAAFPGTLFQIRFLIRDDVIYTLRVA